MRIRRSILVVVAASTLMLACTPVAWWNNTAWLGGGRLGGRGTVQVSFINNTPYRAIFTFGVYDPQFRDFTPEFRQFFASSDARLRLEGNTSSDVYTFTCARAVSVGGEQFVTRILEEDDLFSADDNSVEAIEAGVAFSDKPLGDPNDEQPTAGRDGGITTLNGAEFQCDSLLIYTFEVDDTEPDGFRIDLTVVLP